MSSDTYFEEGAGQGEEGAEDRIWDKKIKEVESRLHCLENELLLLKQEKKGIFHRIKEMIHKKRI